MKSKIFLGKRMRVAALLMTAAMLLGACGKEDALFDPNLQTISEEMPTEELSGSGDAGSGGIILDADSIENYEKEREDYVAPELAEPAKERGEITIVYTNDVHTYINNQVKDEEGNYHKALTYSSVAAYVNELRDNGENVVLVDAGDHSQGTAFGGMDEGKSVIQLMNTVGYQVATLGNHEFDYGMFRAFAIMDEANYTYVSCNFYDAETGIPVLPAYSIQEVNGVTVAFIGISTPDTLTKTTPTYFMDEKGNYLYGFYAGNDGQELYASVQAAIDEVKNQADYVVALGHLGVDISSEPYTSREVIAHTTGLDAFIDGHSHTTIEREEVKDAAGKTVILTQTGSYLKAIGQMTLTDEEITTMLVTDYDQRDAEVEALEDAWVGSVNDILGEEIAVNDKARVMADEDGVRLVRRSETNLGDLCADGLYYYFNEVKGLDCDVALQNGGGIRATIEEGPVTYMTTKTVMPFGNVGCLVNVTGQTLLDALEKGAAMVGVKDPETGAYAESGGFFHVAGMTYEINVNVESTVQYTEEGTWAGSPTGEYKVTNVKIYNKEAGTYEPLELDKIYRVAGLNYHLRNLGDGMTMFADSEVVLDYVGEDYLIFADYLKAFKTNADGVPEITTENSPLAAYEGYLLDYENMYGSGRIKGIAN